MRRNWIIATVILLLGAACPTRAQLATVFLEEGFEDDTSGTHPNAPATGSWVVPAQTTTGVAVITNDVVSGPFSSTNTPFSGTNFLRIERTDGSDLTARLDAIFGTITPGNTITAAFAFKYESTGQSSAAIQLYSGGTRRVAIFAEHDLGSATFYTLNGDLTRRVDSSLAITPGVWQTIAIQYTSGSTNLALKVGAVWETLEGAISDLGPIDTIRFSAGNTYSTFYIDGDIKVESTTNALISTSLLLQEDFQSDLAGTTTSGADLDPAIGSGDIGGYWEIRENTAAYIRVINDDVPGNDTPGTNNYLHLIRGGSSGSASALYGTGWDPSTTSNQVVQLDFDVWQEPAPDLGVVFLNQAIPSAPLNFTYGNATVWTDIMLGDQTWHSVRIKANFDSSRTQVGVPPQAYTLSVDGGLATTNAFNAVHNQVQTLGFYTGVNDHTDYIDNVRLQVISGPLTLSIETLPDKNQALKFTGMPGGTYVIQTATNLTDWVSVSTNTTDSAGQFIYTDLSSTNYTQRFYRGMSQ